MKSDTIYEVYAYYVGEGFRTLWLCKSKETAEYLLAWETAALYDNFLGMKKLHAYGEMSFEKYKSYYAPEFKIGEVEVYE